MEYLKIKNWDRWQSYRKDRGQPPWIKIHRRLMRNPEWVSLSDSERGQLTSIWLLAADHDGSIPADSDTVKKLCFMSDELNINKLIDLGFIESPCGHSGCQDDVKMTPGCSQDVTPKAEAKADKNRIEADKKKLSSSETQNLEIDNCPHQEIINLYHDILPSLPKVKKWPVHLQVILRTRWSEDPERQYLDWWEKYFNYVKLSPFLMGQKTEFIADLEWLIRPKNFTKIANGRYHQFGNGEYSEITARNIANLQQWMEETSDEK